MEPRKQGTVQRRTAQARRGVVLLVAAVFASTLATFVNPQGVGALAYPLSYLGESKAQHQTFIAEWLPPAWSDSAGFFVYAACAILGLVVRCRRVRPADAALTVALLGFALSSRRHVVLFVVATGPAMVVALQAVASKIRAALGRVAPGMAAELGSRSTRLREIEAAPSVHLLGVVTATVVAVLVIGGFLPKEPMHVGEGFPDQTLHLLEAAPASDRVFAQYRWGGYLIWHLPARPVFIDGRLDVYPREVYEQYLDVTQLRAGWRDALDQYDVRYILVRPDLPAATLPDVDPAWTVVSEDPAAVLLAR